MSKAAEYVYHTYKQVCARSINFFHEKPFKSFPISTLNRVVYVISKEGTLIRRNYLIGGSTKPLSLHKIV
jgi:hypothetical protein